MKLIEHFERIRTASTATVLEKCFQQALSEYRSRRSRSRIWKGVRQRGLELCDLYPQKELVPRLGSRRRLSLCGDSYIVGYGGNGSGERWVWASAKQWVIDTLLGRGIPASLSKSLWDRALNYPHRAIIEIDQFLKSGELTS
jgi:hypothetical protein